MLENSQETDKSQQVSSSLEKTVAELRTKLAAEKAASLRNERALQVLRQFALSIGVHPQVTDVLHKVIVNVVDLLSASEGGALFIHNEKHARLVLVAQHKLGQGMAVRSLQPGEGLAGQVFQLGTSLLVKDYEHWEGRLKIDAYNIVLSALGVPLMDGEKVSGALVLYTEKGGCAFTEEDLELAELFVSLATMAYQSIASLERLELELVERKKLESRERELRALAQTMFDITAILNASLDVEDVLDNMLINIHRIAPGDVVCIFIVSNDIARAVRSRTGDPILAGFLATWSFVYNDHPIFTRLAAEQGPLLFSNEEHFIGAIQPQLKAFKSFIGSSIRIRENLIGFVFIGNYAPEAYHQEHVRRLQAFSNQSALAINNARLYQEVQSLAITDPLTGVYNRRGFLRFGRQEINRAMRFGRPLSMLFFDIDHFKAFNDRFSYEIGDEVLRKVAQVAQVTVRNVDLIGRYGGEEFIVLVPEVMKEAAVVVAERLRMRVESLRLHTVYGDLGVTISVGVAAMDFPKYQTKPLEVSEEDLLERLIQDAGRMLRRAKEAGRNRVSVQENQGGFSTLK